MKEDFLEELRDCIQILDRLPDVSLPMETKSAIIQIINERLAELLAVRLRRERNTNTAPRTEFP